jgi:Zn finger protein HypA/HybF involved in hydrogenase expression
MFFDHICKDCNHTNKLNIKLENEFIYCPNCGKASKNIFYYSPSNLGLEDVYRLSKKMESYINNKDFERARLLITILLELEPNCSVFLLHKTKILEIEDIKIEKKKVEINWWYCECGCENPPNQIFCMNCSKKRKFKY